MTFMIGMVSCVAVFVLQAGNEPYSPDRHRSTIKSSFTSAEAAMKSFAAKKATRDETAAKLGKLMGTSRRLQTSLNFWMQQGQKVDGQKAIRVIQLSGTFDAYISSSILGLEGDATSREFGKVLSRRLSQWLGVKPS